jgi:dTDP-4-amino-4,6-dideoxygalactose transaminase
MERKRIYLCLAHMSEDGMEQKYVKEAFDTNWVVPLGPNVNGFEHDLEEFVNENDNENEKLSKRVVALSSGTAAVHLGLLNCGVKAGDEVIVQSFTFCASTHPVTYLGAKPVLVDSEPDTWNIDPELLEVAIIDRKEKTGRYPKAIVPVALYGMPYKADRIMEIANRYGIPVVEDAAEGFGSKYKGQVLGTFGKYGVLSFNGNKMITTSGGGALITANEDEWREIMMYATQYRESYPYYQHEKIGYNYRMSNICAGIGRGQMTIVNDHLVHHKHVQKLYEELLKDVPGITVHRQMSNEELGMSNEATPVYDSNYWLCTITIDPEVKVKGQEDAYKTIVTGAVGGAAGVIHAAESAHTDCEPNANVEAMRVALDKAQIEARPLWKPMHKQPCYKDAPAYVNGVSEGLFKIGMCLPAGPYVSDEDVRYIVDTIKEAIL